MARRRPRLLLVEDETTLRRLYESMLLPQYDVVGCETAAEAAALAGLTKPDLILSDINLPDRMGLDMLAQILGGDETSRLYREFKYEKGMEQTKWMITI